MHWLYLNLASAAKNVAEDPACYIVKNAADCAIFREDIAHPAFNLLIDASHDVVDDVINWSHNASDRLVDGHISFIKSAVDSIINLERAGRLVSY